MWAKAVEDWANSPAARGDGVAQLSERCDTLCSRRCDGWAPTRRLGRGLGCHRRIVSGVTRNAAQRSLATSLAGAEMSDPVRPREPRPRNLVVKDRQLVTQHQDLCVLGHVVHAVNRQDLDDPTDQSVEEAERHGNAGSLLGSCLVKLVIASLGHQAQLPSAAIAVSNWSASNSSWTMRPSARKAVASPGSHGVSTQSRLSTSRARPAPSACDSASV